MSKKIRMPGAASWRVLVLLASGCGSSFARGELPVHADARPKLLHHARSLADSTAGNPVDFEVEEQVPSPTPKPVQDALPQCASSEFLVAQTAGGADNEASSGEPSSGEAQPTEPVLVDRVSGLPIEVASLDTRVVNGQLIERKTGQLVQTAPALTHSDVPGGALELLSYPSEQLHRIKTLYLWDGLPGSDGASLSLQIVSVKSSTGMGRERLLTLVGASLTNLVLVQSHNGTRAATLLEPDEAATFRAMIRRAVMYRAVPRPPCHLTPGCLPLLACQGGRCPPEHS